MHFLGHHAFPWTPDLPLCYLQCHQIIVCVPFDATRSQRASITICIPCAGTEPFRVTVCIGQCAPCTTAWVLERGLRRLQKRLESGLKSPERGSVSLFCHMSNLLNPALIPLHCRVLLCTIQHHCALFHFVVLHCASPCTTHPWCAVLCLFVTPQRKSRRNAGITCTQSYDSMCNAHERASIGMRVHSCALPCLCRHHLLKINNIIISK